MNRSKNSAISTRSISTFFLIGAMSSVSSSAFAQTYSCADLFRTSAIENSVVSPFTNEQIDTVFAPILLKGVSQYSSAKETLRENLVKALAEVSPDSMFFPYLGESASRFYAKKDVSYPPLKSIVDSNSYAPHSQYELVERLFRSGYLLREFTGKKKAYSDTSDIDALMGHPESRLLGLAIKSSAENRRRIVSYVDSKRPIDYFNNHLAATGVLATELPGEFYAISVIRKLKMLSDIGADITRTLKDVQYSTWSRAGSSARVKIAKYLLETLSVKNAVDEGPRNTYTGKPEGTTPLMYAIAAKDQNLVDVYVRNGANLEAIVPKLEDFTMEFYGFVAGETVTQFAARNGISLESKRR